MSDSLLLTQEIVETSYRLLTRKLANGGLTARNENAFQLEFGYILKAVGQLYEFKLSDKFHLEFETYLQLNKQTAKSGSNRARIDIVFFYQESGVTTKAAIELKFFKRENHREPNNRYDVYKDLSNLELYKQNGIDLCYFILATDHSHYYNHKVYSRDTEDFDFRHGSSYKAGIVLNYNTIKPYGGPISLVQDYTFRWDVIEDLYFLKVKV